VRAQPRRMLGMRSPAGVQVNPDGDASDARQELCGGPSRRSTASLHRHDRWDCPARKNQSHIEPTPQLPLRGAGEPVRSAVDFRSRSGAHERRRHPHVRRTGWPAAGGRHGDPRRTNDGLSSRPQSISSVALPALDLLAPVMVRRIDARSPCSVPKVYTTAFITSRGLTVRFYRPASRAGATEELTPIRRRAFGERNWPRSCVCGAVAHIMHPQMQAAVLEPQLIQWIQYLAGQTLSCRTDT
jgi:hypothetical protein